LLADDHRVITDGLRALIDSRPDMRVVALASNGADAVRSCLASRPDVAVMDQAMPEMNGTEAVRMIRERCAATRVVMLSMYSNSEHVRRALEAGANGYVLKSSAGDELVEAIRTVHSGRRYLSAPLADELLERMINGSADALSRLSARERQVLKLLADGHSVLHIAGTLSLSRKTVETYRERLMEKLGLRDLPSLVKFALRHGVVELE
jgi:DNA-binding NarL/FixJ family response regulator